jgi:hypothetical protein
MTPVFSSQSHEFLHFSGRQQNARRAYKDACWSLNLPFFEVIGMWEIPFSYV